MDTPLKGARMRDSTGRGRHLSARRWVELAALVLLAAIAVFLWTEPRRREQALSRSSLPELERESARNPNSSRVYYYLGLRLKGAGNAKESEAAFMHAAELDVDDEEIWYAWAGVAAARQETQKTFDILSLFVAKHPRNPRAHLALARWYQDNRAYKRAYEEASAASRLDPNDPEACRLAGIDAMAWNHNEEGERFLRRAVALAPRDWRNQIGLGDALAQDRKGQGAEACFLEAVRLAPEEPIAHLSLGRYRLDHAATAADTDAARVELVKSIVLGPKIPLAHMLLGQTYELEGKWKEARQSLETARDLEPGNTKVAYRLGRVYDHLGDHVAANREVQRYRNLSTYDLERRRLQEAVLQNRADVSIRLKFARLCASHGDTQEAARQYGQILSIAPRTQSALNELKALETNSPVPLGRVNVVGKQ